MEQATTTLPECRRPTCHNQVAIGKNGEPLKDCEQHRDKRPSAKARKASALADRMAARVGTTTPFSEVRRPVTPERRERIDAIKGDMGDREASAAAEVEAELEQDPGIMPSSETAKALLGIEPKITTRWHRTHGKFLSTAIVDGKMRYRYGESAPEAEGKMRKSFK